MNTFAPKSTTENQQAKPERKRPPARDGLSAKATASRASAFVDNRPQAIAQRKLQAMAQQSPQVQHLAQLQAMENNSPRQVAQRQRLQRWFGQPVQRQAGLDDEELQMQAEPGTFQRQGIEDDELLQGKADTMQRQEDREEDELLQGRFDTAQRQALEDEDLLQGRFAGSEPQMQRQGIEDRGENRTGIPDPLMAGLEQLSGLGLSGVRVHHHSSKPAQLNALAYTQGQDIEVGPGQEQHLAHEGWHAVQQMQGRVQPTMQAKGVSINDDKALEHEADVMGAKAMRMNRPDQSDTTIGYRSASALQIGSASGMPVPSAVGGAPGRGTRFDPRSPRELTHIARQANNAHQQIQRFPITVEINQESTEITEENFVEILKNNKNNQ